MLLASSLLEELPAPTRGVSKPKQEWHCDGEMEIGKKVVKGAKTAKLM
jgi:hypothetical protein